MYQHTHRSLFLSGPAGRLEAVLWTPSPETPKPLFAAVVCHPHPLFGGTLHNKVVYQVTKTIARLGLPVLRFNFRGAGRSDGKYDNGRGERDDARAALDFLALEVPALPLLLAGFSFGCWVGLRAGCEDSRVAELIGLGAPVNDSDFSYLQDCSKPKLFLQGEHDQFGAEATLKSLVGSLPGENELAFIPGADHFFTGQFDPLDAALTAWLTSRHPKLAAR